MSSMVTESPWNGPDAQEDLAADASCAMELVTGLENVPRLARKEWMSSLESASSAVNLAIWPDFAEVLIPEEDAQDLITIIVAEDLLLLPFVMVDVVVPLSTMEAEIPTIMVVTAAAVATHAPLTVDMVDLLVVIVSARPTLHQVATAVALPLLTTVMEVVDALLAPMGKSVAFFWCGWFLFYVLAPYTPLCLCQTFFCSFCSSFNLGGIFVRSRIWHHHHCGYDNVFERDLTLVFHTRTFWGTGKGRASDYVRTVGATLDNGKRMGGGRARNV